MAMHQLGIAPVNTFDVVTKTYADSLGGGSATIRVVTGTTTAVTGNVILANATTGGFTVTVPITAGATVTVKKTDASANAVTVVGTSGLVDGDANATLIGQDASAVFIGDGTNVQIQAINGLATSSDPVLSPLLLMGC